MKHTALWLLFPLAMFSPATAGHARGTPTDEQARGLAIATVAKATNTAVNELNTRRREDLEDTLFSFQRKVVGRIHKSAYFYEVVNGGYHISLDEVTYSTPTQRWLVAVSTDDGATFGLEGFTDAEGTFGRLLSKAGIEVRNASQAEAFTRFYLDTVYGNAANVLYDEIRLRHKVEEHFVGYADSQEPIAKKEQRYRAWWAELKAKNVGRLAPSVTPEGDNQYLVTLKILSMTVGRPPELSQWSVRVQGNGATQLVQKLKLIPSPLRKSQSKATPANSSAGPQGSTSEAVSALLSETPAPHAPSGVKIVRNEFIAER